MILEGELERVVTERYRKVSAMGNYFEDHNTKHVSAESIKAANDH